MKPSFSIRTELTLDWSETDAEHRDRLFIPRINLWRDLLPEATLNALKTAGQNQTIKIGFDPGTLTPAFDKTALFKVPNTALGRLGTASGGAPRVGRFYPRGVFASALGCFPQDIRPSRVTGREDGLFTVDLNHPLSRFPLSLEMTVLKSTVTADERGGSVNVVAELVTENGPGMQGRFDGAPTDFFHEYPFKRSVEESDAAFYEKPRWVYHIDATAADHVRALYGRLLSPGIRVLDLMSSWVSHLPEKLSGCDVTGLGMNAEELSANPALSRFVVHDLNWHPKLPFEDGAFDAVICTSSVEYLTRPVEVFSDVARILKPGGLFVNTFSDRWFPPKVITLWEALHPFERVGFVLECMRQSGRYRALHSESIRGDTRPADDKYAALKKDSDPVFAVWGMRL